MLNRKYNRPNNFHSWIELLNSTDNKITTRIFEDFILWKCLQNGIWQINWGVFKAKIDGVLNFTISDNFYHQTVQRMVIVANKLKDKNWQNYRSRLIFTHKDINTIHERFVKSIEVPEASKTYTAAIDSDLGTGKTQWFYEQYIQHSPLNKSILIITPRRSLAKTAAHRYKVVDYEDAKNRHVINHVYDNRIYKMSVCVNSILRLVSADDPIDVVFLDEFDLTIEHLIGEAVSDKIREELIFHLMEIIRNAKHVICAQNLVSDLAISFLKKAGRNNIVKIVNTYQPWQHLQVDFFRKKKQAIHRLLQLIQTDKKFLCPCNSADVATTLFTSINKRYPDKNILLLTADTIGGHQQNEFIKDPNKHLKKYFGLVFSPVIGLGISLKDKNFQEVVGFCSVGEKVNTPEAFVQMLLRGRAAKRISLFVDQQRTFLYETPEECVAEIVARFSLVADQIDLGEDAYVNFKLSEATKLAIHVTVLKNKQKNNTCQFVYNLLSKRMGCQINLIENQYLQDNKQSTGIIKEGRKLKRADYLNNVKQARVITERDYNILRRLRAPRDTEYWAIRRYKLESELCLNLDDVTDSEEFKQIIEFWNEGRVVGVLEAFEMAVMPEEQAKAIAQQLMSRKMPEDKEHGFFIRWQIRSSILQSLQISFENGEFKCNPDLMFSYKDLMKEWWYEFICQNLMAVNAANLGCRITPKVTERDIGNIIRALGIKLIRKRPPRTLEEKEMDKVEAIATGKRTKKKNSAYLLDLDAMAIFIKILRFRYQTNKFYLT